jgi:hypothetical protein
MWRSLLGLIGLSLTICLGILPAGSVAIADTPSASDRAWAGWYRDLEVLCPAHHVEWLYGAAYQPLYEGFDATLAAADRKRVEILASAQQFCANERIGHSCQLGRRLEAYHRMGLAKKFAQYSCRQVVCEEGALCSRAPGQ